MIFFLRLLPVLNAAWLIVTFRLALSAASTFWYFAGLGVAGVLASLWLLTRRASLPQGRWTVLAFPALTLFAVAGTLLFSERVVLQWVLFLTLSTLVALYTEQAFRFSYTPARYQPNALVNLGLVFAILSVFFVSLTLYDFQLFANAPLWLGVSIFAAVMVTWCVAAFRLIDAPKALRWPWGLTVVIVSTEIFALFAWFPVLPFVKAASVAILLTGMLQRVRDDALGTERSYRWATVALVVMLLCVLVTARWFA